MTMKKLSEKEQKNIIGGRIWYHWFCKVNGFLSTSYSVKANAIAVGKKHASKYGHTWGTTTVLATHYA